MRVPWSRGRRAGRGAIGRGLRSASAALAVALGGLVAWLASAEPALAAQQALRLTDLILDPRILAIGALILVAAWLGFTDRWRPGHHRR